MNYKSLVNRSISTLLDREDLSVSDVIRTITREKHSGLQISNRSRFENMSDEDWYDAIEKSIEELGSDSSMNEEEWQIFLKNKENEKQ